MLRRALRGHNQALLIDGTHDTNTAGFKLISIGTEDRWRRFHLVAVGITVEETADELASALSLLRIKIHESRDHGDPEIWSPRIAIADGSPAISRAIKTVFPDTIRTNCYFHVKSNVRKRFEKHKDYAALQCDLSILANARSHQQFEAWASCFLRRWDYDDEIGAFFSAKFNHQWEANFFWGVGGLCCLSNSRTNNGTEAFNKEIKSTWVRRSICSIPRLIAILKSAHMEVTSREGCELDNFDPHDFYQDKLLNYWKQAASMIDSLDGQLAVVQDNHFMSGYGGTGTTYAVGHVSQEEISKMLCGDFDPFTEDIQGSLTFVPSTTELSLLPPGEGSVCTCQQFITDNLCAHILLILNRRHGIALPHQCIQVGKALRSHGITRPKDPFFGGRNCLRGVCKKIRKKKRGGRSTICEVMRRGTLFLAFSDGAVDLFAFNEESKNGIKAQCYWYDSGVWKPWRGRTKLVQRGDICRSHFNLVDGRIPPSIMEELRLCDEISDP
jgi:hypothetical protein